MNEKEKSKKAVELSVACEWDGSQIMDIMQLALEDANFHTFNEQLSELREKFSI